MGNSCCKEGEGTKSSLVVDVSAEDQKISLRGRLLRENPENSDVRKYYKHIEVVGEGSISAIWLVKKKGFNKKDAHGQDKRMSIIQRMLKVFPYKSTSSQVYALKSILTAQISKSTAREIRNEIQILKHLDHPNIVKAYETFEYKGRISIVMEYCSGGDLYERSPYSEHHAAHIVSKILSALSYLHKNNVAHRDLKFENIMFENDSPNAEVKIIDFGLSKRCISKNQEKMTRKVGTFYTMAPEVLEGSYTSKADLWSVGVIAYMLLSGKRPFCGKKRKKIGEKIRNGKYDFKNDIWNDISKEAKKFVTSLLDIDPKKRPNADEALGFIWLTEAFPKKDHNTNQKKMHAFQNNLINYTKSPHFKKLALMIIAHKSSMEDIIELREAFELYDTGNDGTISYAEFKSAFANFPGSEDELNSIFRNVNLNDNGQIYYTEFLAATLETQGKIEINRLKEAFDRFDTENKGYITKENLLMIFGSTYNEEELEKILDEVDIDKDGNISFEEFKEAFRDKKMKEKRNSLCLNSSHDDFSLEKPLETVAVKQMS